MDLFRGKPLCAPALPGRTGLRIRLLARNHLTKFNSNNTRLPNVEQVQQKLLRLAYFRDKLAAWKEKQA